MEHYKYITPGVKHGQSLGHRLYLCMYDKELHEETRGAFYLQWVLSTGTTIQVKEKKKRSLPCKVVIRINRI